MNNGPRGPRSLLRALRGASAAALALLLTACAMNTGTVVLLPEKDGRSTAVVVKQGTDEVVLDQPYAAARQTSRGAPKSFTANAQDVQALAGAALAAQPARPTRFVLYFIEGGDEFTEESKLMLPQILAEISQRPVPDVLVVGHTDTKGSDQVNDALARQRAETVRASLIGRGIAPENIVAVGRGKRQLLKPTPDNVSEPLNRRVEIIVR
jgi:outer membrane protein OmpA-like peptidoglycan-associated protein